jgi:hypothetical protein
MKRARGTNRAMATAMRVECHKESNGFGGKSNCNMGGNNQLAMCVFLASSSEVGSCKA